MKLSAKVLGNVNDVNSWEYQNQAEFSEGDTTSLFLQLVDLSKDRADQGFNPSGRRYMPEAGALLTVVFDHIDDARKVTRPASQPFPEDPSIWEVAIMSTDTLRGTVNLKLSLNEGGTITSGYVQAGCSVCCNDGMTRL
jgi:hypothetical protein